MRMNSAQRDIAVASACFALAAALVVAALVQDLYSTLFLSVPLALASLVYVGVKLRARD